MSEHQPATINDALMAIVELGGAVKSISASFTDRFSDLHADIASLREDIVSVREDVASVREDVAGVREDVAGVREDVVTLRKDVTSEFETVRAEATRLRVQMMSRFERLENSLSQIKDEMAVTWHKTERAYERTDSLRAEMSETDKQITAMWRIVRRVQSEWENLKGRPASPGA